jgi:cyanate permease
MGILPTDNQLALVFCICSFLFGAIGITYAHGNDRVLDIVTGITTTGLTISGALARGNNDGHG